MVDNEKASGEQSPEDRMKRERLLAAVLEAFPTAPLHPYAEASERYQRLYQNRSEAGVRGMLVSRLAIVMRRWRKHVDDKLKERGQNIIRWQTLFELAVNEDGETLTSIAMRVGAVGPRLVRILEELESDGLIERTVDEQDRRSKLIVLTPAGEQVVSTMFELELEIRKEFFKGIGESEMLLMLDSVKIMTDNLDRIIANDAD